jgi:hypothetical protein
MLSRIPSVRQACDLDLLLFFYRHPCALLTNEQLVSYLGYDREQVAKSLDGLIAARLVTRSQNPSHAARLYALETGAVPGGLLSSFLKLAATRQGRQDAMRLLEPDPARTSSGTRRSPVARIA